MNVDATVTVKQVVAALRREPRTVVAVAVSVLVASLVVTLLTPVSFRSRARLYLGDVKKSENAERRVPWRATLDEVTSEIELLRSQWLIEQAVLGSGLNARVSTGPRSSTPFFRWLLDHEEASRIDEGRRYVSVRDARLADPGAEPRSYRLQLSQGGRFALTSQGVEPQSGVLGKRIELPDGVLTIAPGPDPIPPEGLSLRLRVASHRAIARKAARRLLVFAPKAGKRAGPVHVVTLQYRDPSPRLAADFLTALLDAYSAMRSDWRSAEGGARKAQLASHTSSVREALVRHEQRLTRLRASNADTAEQIPDVLLRRIRGLEARKREAELERLALEAHLRGPSAGRAPAEAQMLGEASDPFLEQLSHRVAQARKQEQALSAEYEPEAKELQRARARLTHSVEALRRFGQQRLQQVASRIHDLNAELDALRTRASKVPGLQAASSMAGRGGETRAEVLLRRLQAQHEAALREAGSVSRGRVIDPPRVARQPDVPDLSIALSTVFVGLLLGVLVVILRALNDRTFRDEAEVRQWAAGLPLAAVVSAVPDLRGLRRQTHEPDGGDGGILAEQRDREKRAQDELRFLAVSLRRLAVGGGCQVVALTAAQRGSGSTRCALALGRCLEAQERRVLVVDADFLAPSHHHLVGFPATPGLSDLYRPAVDVTARDAEQQWSLANVLHRVGNVDYVGAGSWLVSSRLGLSAFEVLLREARREYEFVVVDVGAGRSCVWRDAILSRSHLVLTVVRVRVSERRPTAEHLWRLSTGPTSAGIVIANGAATSM